MPAISGFIESLVAPGEPGVAVAVLRDGAVAETCCVGLADLAQGVPIRPDTRFHIVSVSKTVMAASILVLAARGKLSLDDDIRRHLPELRHPGTVTIRHLLSLTSGLRDVLEIERLRGVWHTSASRQQDLLRLAAAQTEVSLTPSDAYLYTNVNHVLLEQIVARAGGGSSEVFRQEAIYAPLGMTATAARPHDGIALPGLAQPYARVGDAWVRPHDLLGIAGDVLTSTVEDLSRWVLALRVGRIGDVSLAAMAEPSRLADGSPLYYGLGLAVRRYRGLTALCHTGSQPGYKAHIAYVPARDLGVVVLANREDIRPAPLAARIMDMLLGADFPAPMPRSIGVVDAALAGTYVDTESGEWLDIAVEDDVLRAETCGDTLFLYRGGDGVFRDADDYRAGIPAMLTFEGRDACHLNLGGIRARLTRQAVPRVMASDYVGRYENAAIDSAHAVTVDADGLNMQYGLGFDAARRFPLQPIAPDIFLARPSAPGVAHRHVFRFERDGAGRVVAAIVTMERLKGVRLSRRALQ